MWFLIADKGPEKNKRLLVYDSLEGATYIAEWDGKFWYSDSMSFNEPEPEDITHWAELPEYTPSRGCCATDCECHGKREGDPYP